MKYRLSELAIYDNNKITIDKINVYNYISTENLLPNRCGYTIATTLPNQNSVLYAEKGNILISNIRPYFKKIIYADKVLGCSNDVLNIKVTKTEKILTKYLYYILFQDEFFEYVMAGVKGTKMPRGDKNHIMNYEFEVPDITVQTKIVKILDELQRKIELNNQTNDNLYELGDTLYKEYYSKYENELPNGYKYLNLNDVSVNYDSKRKPMSSREREQHKGEYPYYGATSIIDYVDDYIFDDTYLLMGEDGTVKTAEGYPVLQYIWGKNWINNHAHVLQGTIISTEHLMFALRKKNIEALITGAVQPKINQVNMNKIKIIIGTDDVNKKFEEEIKVIVAKIKVNLVENETLTQIRDTLLPKLMNGEIDLEKIEI